MSSAVAVPTRRVWKCMGTVFSVDVRGGGVSPAVIDEQVEFSHAVDAALSTYRADSEVSRLVAGTLAISNASPMVREVVRRCDELRQTTDGYFDAYAGGQLDPSGYVKGWAIARISDALEAAGSTRHCVNGGGDVQCLGTAGHDEPWRIGIVHPHDRHTFVDVVAGAGRLAVATSGTAERGEHITDPRGRAGTQHWSSVSVIGREIDQVDAYATACFAMGEPATAWLRAQGLAGVLVTRQGHVERVVPQSR